MRRLILTLLSAVLLAAGAVGGIGAPGARADATSGVISAASFTPTAPATAGSGDTSTAQLSFSYSDSTDTAKSLSLTFAPGLLAAPTAVATTCSTAQLAAAACPAGSEIGTGQATVGTFIGPQTATVGIYLMPAPDANSIVGVGVILNATVLGAVPVTTETSGSASFITGAGGQPQLQITLPSLPSSVTVPLLGSVAIQLNQLTMTLNGQGTAGSQFLYLPTNCTAATTSFAVTSQEGASGAATASFTPTGCPLAYTGGSVGAAAQVVDANNDAAFQTSVSFPTGGANTGAITITIPNTALRANPAYAGLNCPTTAPFSGCVAIGTVTASTPLLPTALSGTAYLTGSVAGYGIGLVFPAPVSLALNGSVNSLAGATTVTFPSLPDLPLSSLQLALTGSSSSAFQASCGAGTQTLTAAFTGNGGSGTLTRSTTLGVTGCPATTAGGGGSQVAQYGGAPNAAPHITAITLSGVANRHPVLALTLATGTAKLRSFRLTLPSALGYVARHATAHVTRPLGSTRRVIGDQLRVQLKTPRTGTVTLRITRGGLSASAALARKVMHGSVTKIHLGVTAFSAGPRTTVLHPNATLRRR